MSVVHCLRLANVSVEEGGIRVGVGTGAGVRVGVSVGVGVGLRVGLRVGVGVDVGVSVAVDVAVVVAVGKGDGDFFSRGTFLFNRDFFSFFGDCTFLGEVGFLGAAAALFFLGVIVISEHE